jgi:lipid-binding SYLF domain-containing protein
LGIKEQIVLRRTFIWSTPASILALGLAISGCTTTSPSDTGGQQIDKRHTIDAGVDSTLARLYGAAKGSRELVSKAHGVLTFPSVIDAGFVVGGQYGEGSLRVGGRTVGYYSMVTGSIGWQIGAQSRAIVFLFMTDESLDRFRSTDGWSAGGDASVAVLKVGANGDVDTSTATGQVDAFVLTNSGLMAGVSLDGTKVTRLKSL